MEWTAMKRNYTLSLWTIFGAVALIGALSAHAEADVNKLTKEIELRGIVGLAALIEAGKPEVPHIESGDSPASEPSALLFGRELLQAINGALQKGERSTVDEITSLLEISEWLKDEPAYGNLVIAHRALDVAGALTLKALGSDASPSDEVIVLASRVAKTTMEPLYRARVLDEELGTKLLSEQLASVAMDEREQTVRKLWKNLCFLGYSEANPAITRELDQAKQSIVQSLGSHADAFLSLGKTVPQNLLAPKTLQYTSTELLEARNLWFVSMASAPGNLSEIGSVIAYLDTAKKLPETTAGASKQLVEQAFANEWASLDVNGSPTIASRAADVAYRVRSGAPLDRDSTIRATEAP